MFGYLDIAQLSGLSKCVVCGSKWAVRKQPKHKLAHIESCAKKQGYREETVCALISNQLDKPSALPEQRCSDLPAETVEPPKTIFHDIIDKTAPKKRSRRLAVIETIKKPEDTWKNIASKAGDLIERTSSPIVSGRRQALISVINSQISCEDECDSDEIDFFPATQPFGESNLGNKLQSSHPYASNLFSAQSGDVFPQVFS
jgi:hypothetical protein